MTGIIIIVTIGITIVSIATKTGIIILVAIGITILIIIIIKIVDGATILMMDMKDSIIYRTIIVPQTIDLFKMIVMIAKLIIEKLIVVIVEVVVVVVSVLIYVVRILNIQNLG
jgi:hypothetical protein